MTYMMSSVATHPGVPLASTELSTPIYDPFKGKVESTINVSSVRSFDVFIVGTNGLDLFSISPKVTFNINSCRPPAVKMTNSINQTKVSALQGSVSFGFEF